MSKITLENNMPCTVIAVLGDENDKVVEIQPKQV